MAIPNDPITREEQYLASMAGQEVDLPQPITRVEKYLAKASGMDVETPDPITREEKYLDAIAEGGGGGSSITVEPLTVTQNGTTTAPSGKAYSPVTANVPNSYGASDEGKVVNNGALVAQTAHAPVTANGTIDTTFNNSVTVNVPASAPVLETLTVTANGTYTPEEGVDGFDEVEVNVQGGDTARKIIERSGTSFSADEFSGATVIGDSAFSGWPLEEIDIPNTITSIGSSAFSFCPALRSVFIPNSVTTIGPAVFYGCSSLTSATLPNEITSIELNAFRSSGLTSVIIPASVNKIGNSAFSDCKNLATVHLLPMTPPVLDSTSFGASQTRTFYVPRSEGHTVLNAYKTATNWARHANYIQEEPV